MKDDKMYAREKLRETFYFLLQMRNSYVDREHFVYNMNAFLNSARNVTFTLQEEFAHDPRFSPWYSEKQNEMKADKLMVFFNDLRVISVHKKGSPRHSFSVKAAYILPTGKGFQRKAVGYSERKYSDEDKVDMDTFGIMFEDKLFEPLYTLATNWKFEKAPEGYAGEDILALCIEYYHKLRRIVEEAQSVIFRKK